MGIGDDAAMNSVDAYEAVLRPRRPVWHVFACALVVCALLAWCAALYAASDRAARFRAFELALARICIDNGGVYAAGSCGAPSVSFTIVPFRALPEDRGEQPVPREPTGGGAL